MFRHVCAGHMCLCPWHKADPTSGPCRSQALCCGQAQHVFPAVHKCAHILGQCPWRAGSTQVLLVCSRAPCGSTHVGMYSVDDGRAGTAGPFLASCL